MKVNISVDIGVDGSGIEREEVYKSKEKKLVLALLSNL